MNPVPKKSKHPFRRSFRSRKIDFIAQVPLETTVEQISDLVYTRTSFAHRPEIRTESWYENEDTCFVKFRCEIPKSVRIQAQGYLKRWEADTTHVSIRLKPSFMTQFIPDQLPATAFFILMIGLVLMSGETLLHCLAIWSLFLLVQAFWRILENWNLWIAFIQMLEATFPVDYSSYRIS